MATEKRRLGLASVFVAVVLACAPKRADPPVPATYVVEGVVVDSSGRAMAGVDVGVFADTGDRLLPPPDPVVTGRDGQFRFRGLERHRYYVRASMEGFANARVLTPPGVTDVRVVLSRPASVSGVVVREDGTPVAAKLTVLADYHWHWGYATQTTDGAGAFSFAGRNPGSFPLRARTDDGEEGEVDVDLVEGVAVEGVRIVVSSPFRSEARIRVQGANGERPPARVHLFVGWEEREAVSENEHGDLFVIRSRRARGETLRASVCRGMREPLADLELVLAAPGAEPREVRLPDRVWVKFRTEPEIPDLRVVATHGPSEIRCMGTEAWLSPACRYDVRFSAPGYMSRVEFDWKPEAESPELAVSLVRAPVVRGRVVGLGDVSTAKVRVRLSRGDESADVRSDGTFSIEVERPGRQTLIVQAAGGLAARVDIDVQVPRVARLGTGGVDVGDIRVRPARVLRGRVVDAKGRPVGGARVLFAAPSDPLWGDGEGEAEPWTFSHADGRFILRAADFDGALFVGREGFGLVPVAIGRGPVRGLEVRLGPAASVRIGRPEADVPSDSIWQARLEWPDEAPGVGFPLRDFLPMTVDVAPGALTIVAWTRSYREGPVAPWNEANRRASVRAEVGRTIAVDWTR